MAPTRIGPLAQAWYKWKALRLPWRKRFLVGFDLDGNTYWEFRLTSRGGGGGGDHDANASGNSSSSSSNPAGEERWRRIVQYPRSTHYSEIKVPPQWHSWLRHTRRDPPPLAEQAAEVARQARIKELAAAADRRWEAKPRVMEAPRAADGGALAAPEPALKTTTTAEARHGQGHEEGGKRDEGREEKGERDGGREEKRDPWQGARRRGLGEDWQPTAWTPGTTKDRS